MKTTLVVGAFLAAVLITSPLFAFAKAGDPIPGVPIGLDHDPGGVIVSQTKTNSAGVAVFRNVKPGKYRIIIDAIFDRWGQASNCPCAADIEIKVPGQAKVVRIVSKADAHSRITAIAIDPRDVSGNRLLMPFTVTGSKIQTVTVAIVTSRPHG